MLVRSIFVTLLTLLGFSSVATADSLETLPRSAMKTGDVYRFTTTGRTYKAKVVDQKSGECLVSASSDGKHFGKPRKAYILGATRGDQAGIHFVIMFKVQVGMGIELAVEDYGKKNRYLTSEVTDIELIDRATPTAEVASEPTDRNSA